MTALEKTAYEKLRAKLSKANKKVRNMQTQIKDLTTLVENYRETGNELTEMSHE